MTKVLTRIMTKQILTKPLANFKFQKEASEKLAGAAHNEIRSIESVVWAQTN